MTDQPLYDREAYHDRLGRKRSLRAKGIDPVTGELLKVEAQQEHPSKEESTFDATIPVIRDPFLGL